ncbi:hypothetical protein BDV93DRAFT_609831 [Ceratobasidium sp. AG-I]|nr:hypothetical protein BDV93DRAFT_609831 [Ceratobasidium sp. AG-I]
MIVYPTTVSALFGGDGTSTTTSFDDTANDLKTPHSINKIEFNSGWVLDGMRVTYSTVPGLERQVVHGTFSPSNVGDKVVSLGANEYVSKAEGVHGRPNGQYDYGDCIQKIQFTIKNSETGQQRTAGPFGSAQSLKPQDAKSFSWEGHLYAFAGRADNTLGQVGLKGLSFVERSGAKITLAVSAPYAGDRPSGLIGQAYDDLADFGAKLNFTSPIKSINVWSGQVVDGLEITYNFADKTTKTVMHGAKGGACTEVPLGATERIVEVNGLHGVSFPQANWGDQVQLLTFTIYDSATGFSRSTRTFGLGQEFVQETRKDIYVKGPLVAFAGTANNSQSTVGLNTIKFYTQTP